MRILIVHEQYVNRGGEDEAVKADHELLREAGHQVDLWEESNETITSWPAYRRAALAWKTIWSRHSHETMRRVLEKRRPDVVHIHNTLPLLSPSIIHAARSSPAALVMTAHNYRLLCPVATLRRNGTICEDCVDGSLANGVLHGCYRNSRLQTGVVATMLAVHRRLGTWSKHLDAIVALTVFMRDKLVQGGFPAERVHVRPNFARPVTPTSNSGGDYAVFVGRLSEEKGIATLLDAARHLKDVRLRIVGGGPLEPAVRKAEADLSGRIEYLGSLPHDEALDQIRGARVLVFPSTWYEGFPMTIAEAYAAGVPVIASRLGAMAEIVTNEQEGILVEPSSAEQLAAGIQRIHHDSLLRQRLGANARQAFEKRYSPQRSYERLCDIYEAAMATRSGGRRRGMTL